MNKLNKLTWKYFIRNKLLEILGVSAFILITYYLGKLFGCGNIGVCTRVDYFLQGMIFWIPIVIIGYFVISFIGLNWDWAKEQAKGKLKKGKSKK